MRTIAKSTNKDGTIRFRMGTLFRRIYERVEQLRQEIEVPDRPGVAVAVWPRRPLTDAEERCAELERYLWHKREFRRGRAAGDTVSVLSAYDDWLADPETSWSQLARKYGFRDKLVLECACRRLKRILKREGVQVPDRVTLPPS